VLTFSKSRSKKFKFRNRLGHPYGTVSLSSPIQLRIGDPDGARNLFKNSNGFNLGFLASKGGLGFNPGLKVSPYLKQQLPLAFCSQKIKSFFRKNLMALESFRDNLRFYLPTDTLGSTRE
jgi:hypothetical protein